MQKCSIQIPQGETGGCSAKSVVSECLHHGLPQAERPCSKPSLLKSPVSSDEGGGRAAWPFQHPMGSVLVPHLPWRFSEVLFGPTLLLNFSLLHLTCFPATDAAPRALVSKHPVCGTPSQCFLENQVMFVKS